jgi:hypothetical protein
MSSEFDSERLLALRFGPVIPFGGESSRYHPKRAILPPGSERW